MSALLTTFGIDWHLLVAQVVNFLLLVAALTWFLYKPVLKMVRERERVVAKGVEDAEESARILREADGKAKERVDLAEGEAEKLVEHARRAASDERARILKETEERSLQVVRDAEARAAEAASRALRESEKEVARLAILAAEKVMRQKS